MPRSSSYTMHLLVYRISPPPTPRWNILYAKLERYQSLGGTNPHRHPGSACILSYCPYTHAKSHQPYSYQRVTYSPKRQDRRPRVPSDYITHRLILFISLSVIVIRVLTADKKLTRNRCNPHAPIQQYPAPLAKPCRPLTQISSGGSPLEYKMGWTHG